MSTTVDQIKDRLNVVDVVGQYVKLQKAGKNYRGLSPFNKEKTPSFYVSPDKGMYYCFSSGKGGDIFSFVEEMEGVDFRGALKILAEKAGVEIVPEKKGARDARERLYDMLESASLYYESNLRDNEAVRGYLRKRGLEDLTIRRFRLGFAPDSWESLKAHLLGKGFKEFEIEKAGLIKKGEKGKYYDRFRSRIMFPIMDPAGRVVAFSGRIFGKAAEDKENAKYINSPETQLFEKSRILYGYDKAKGVIRKHDFSILVEGQMDLVLSHQSGFPNTVAVSGTALTPEHLALLDRLSKNVVMAFDADRAGLASALRSAKIALSRGMEVKIAPLPLGVDPADLVREGKDTWREMIRTSKYVVDFFIDHFQQTEKDPRKRQRSARDTILPLLASMPNRMDQAHFAGRLAQALDMPYEAVWEETLRAGVDSAGSVPEMNPRSAAHSNTPADTPARPSRRYALERILAGFIFSERDAPDASRIDLPHFEAELARIVEMPLDDFLKKFAEERDRAMFEAEATISEIDNPREHLADLLRTLEIDVLHDKQSKLAAKIKQAELENNQQHTGELLSNFHELSVKIQKLIQIT